MTQPAFIRNGLQFTCTNCGICCTGAPGLVALSRTEVARLAAHLQLSEEDTRTRYLARHGRGYRILEKPNGDCLFFDGKCSIYPVRPTQCRTYPFWFRTVRSERAWQQAAVQCPGIGQGRWYTEEEIMANVQADLDGSSREHSDV